MKRQVLNCEPILAFNLLVSFCEKTSKDFELISKSDESIELKVFFGDAWSGKKTLKCKIIKTNSEESEVYLNVYAINPFTSGEAPLPLLQQKSVEKYLTEISNYLVLNSTKKPDTDITDRKVPTNSSSEDSLKTLKDLDSKEKRTNRNIIKYFALALVLFFLIIYFIKDSNKYSVCECQPTVGYKTPFKSEEDRFNWCNRKYKGWSQEQLMKKCADEIYKNTFTED
jgi:hypothetical protein